MHLPNEDTALAIEPESFVVTSGFLRAGDDAKVPDPLPPGDTWTYDEADQFAHEFLRMVAGERDVPEFFDDPVEHARANGIMLLFSKEVHESFSSYLERMPEPRAEAWRDLIAGGASSEAFGPLTLQEQLDEGQVEEALQAGRKQRRINVALAAVASFVVVVGTIVLWTQVLSEDGRDAGAFRFDDLNETPEQAARNGGPPVAEPALTAALSNPVAVASGDGPAADRITVAPLAIHPYPPGSIKASLFQYAGSGHVAVVGPAGFVEAGCVRVSVVTADLRPLDTVTHGPCAQPVGRAAVAGCVGDAAVLLDLTVPTGEVDLPEGGTGFADAVRIQVISDDPEYETLTMRGVIEVSSDASVTVPRFGGEVGDELTFDLGDELVGTCTITGDLPEPS